MNKIQFFIIALVLTSCNYLNKESSENVLVSKTVSNEVSFTDSTEQKKIEDSIIIHLGTFLGNEKRNYSGNFHSDSLNVIWKTDLGSGITIVSSKKGEEVWRGAGWTGQPLIVQEKEELFLIQGSFDHGLKKIKASNGQIVWSHPYDDIIKGTGTIYLNDSAFDSNNRILIMQGSRLGNDKNLYSKYVWSYRAISYFTGKEVWRMNVERGKSYSRDVDASALIINDTAYLGLENGSFVVFSPSKTKEIKVNDDLFNSPVIHNKLLLYNQSDIKIHRGNLVTEASPCLIGDKVYIASGSGHVYGYNLITNEIDWDFKIGSDLNGSTIVTEDSCLLLPIEKQYIKGRGGVMKLNPRKDDTSCVEWFFPTNDKNYSSWKGGVIGSPAVNELFKSSFEGNSYAAFLGIDGYLYVVDLSRLSRVKTKGPNDIFFYYQPELIFKKYIGHSISTPVFSEGRLLAAGYKGIYVFKYEDGEFVQTAFKKGRFEATPSVHDGRVYIASRNGYLYCLGDNRYSIGNEHEAFHLAYKEIQDIDEVSENELMTAKNDDTIISSFEDDFTYKQISNKIYIIVGSFKETNNAKRLVDKLHNQGFQKATVIRERKDGFCRVSILETDSIDNANLKLNYVKKIYPNAWMLSQF